MSDPLIEAHLARLKAAAFDQYDLSEIPRYLVEKTYLGGERFSFKDHEYQQDIISDLSRVINVQKCAQVGLTEIQLRYALAVARLIPYFSVIMTWPFSGDASNMVKTRMDPIIQDSEDLRSRIDPNLDNVEVKAIGSSLIYARGTSGTTSALSVPADMLIHDEVDRSDPHTLAQYQSRIKHSKYKMVRAFGTPTIKKHGISLLMETSRRKRHLCKCEHCNYSFAPDYETNVHIPGYEGEKKEITKYNLHKIRWQEAVLLCPKCFKVPSLQPDRREWVIENSGDNYEDVGYYVTPFSAPNIVSIASLVRESTVYTTYSEFKNQALGEEASDDNAQLTAKDVEDCKYTASLDSSELHCGGVDMGLICHFTIGRLTLAGELIVVHRERVLLEEVEKKKRELGVKYRVLMWVFDAYPYTDLILRMQKIDKNLYGSVYHANKKLLAYEIVQADPNAKDGKLPINIVRVHRELNFDEIMYLFKQRKLLWKAQEDDDIFVSHCTDMTRVQDFDRNNEIQYVWQKSKQGNDHFHHALGYLYAACRLMPTASKNASFVGIPLISTFGVKRMAL